MSGSAPSPTAAGQAGIHVAMVIQRFRPHIGGAERQIERLAPALAARGVRVTVVTRRLPGTPRRERLPGLEIVRVRVPRGPNAAGAGFVAGATADLAVLRPDVIHVHGLLSEALVGLAARAGLRTPVVAKLMAAGPRGCVDRLLQKPFGARRLRAIMRRFDALITLSEESDRELTGHGLPPARVVRIPNGVDVGAFRPPAPGERERAREAVGIGMDEPLALYCGRLEAPKRVDRLVEAWAGVPRGRLLIVGAGSQAERIRSLASRPALGGRVVVRPPVDDPGPLYRAADLYVSPSEREGMSNSVLEAMASGLCVVAAPAGGMRELLAGEAGVVLPALPDPGFAAGISAAFADREMRQRHGAAARARVSANYALAGTADRLIDLYRSVGAADS